MRSKKKKGDKWLGFIVLWVDFAEVFSYEGYVSYVNFEIIV